MSFNGQSNPWRGNLNHVIPTPFQGGGPPMFMQQGPGPQPAGINSFAANIFSPSGAGTSIAYPQPRGSMARPTLNPVAFQQQPTPTDTQAQHYNSIGTVTKMNNDCGLVNDEVFFYRNVIKGPIPKLGDRVLFESAFATSGQFQWNATRVQVMQSQTHGPPPLMGSASGVLPVGGKGASYGSAGGDYNRDARRHGSPRRSSPIRDREFRAERERRERERDRDRTHRDDDEHERKRRREERERSRDRNRRDHSGERKEREKERERERERERDKERGERSSPHRSRTHQRVRAIRRYMVEFPKFVICSTSACVQDLRQRYSTMYIPSDFFHAQIKWPESFPPNNQFSLSRPCQFHIMHRIVEPPSELKIAKLEPADANYAYAAKVMLLSCPPLAEIYQKCCEDDDSDSETNTMHPSRMISFLVGTRGRNEPMAIGGPWSPSLDGQNPDKDPMVLIRTAIRTCKTLTGIDLSNCTQWYRFVELNYHRSDYKTNKESKDASSRVEKVVIFIPDVHSCMPTKEEWQRLGEIYKSAVDTVLTRNKQHTATTPTSIISTAAAAAANSTAAAGNATSTKTKEAAIEVPQESVNTAELPGEEIATLAHDSAAETSLKSDVKEEKDTKDSINSTSAQEKAADSDLATHYSKLDVKTMKLQEIRKELECRKLGAKGPRSALVTRLTKALAAEKGKEEKEAAENENTESEKKKVDENEEENEVINTKFVVKTEQDKVEEAKEDTKTCFKNEEAADTEDDAIDVDMTDIVILDEYDASKNQEELKEMDEKEKQQLIRRYTLPVEPHIVVHPNREAKGGKFDCSVMSLAVLLNYRSEDNKERSFEVALFAELFNEMLIRDFGFNIYKELYLYKDSAANAENTKIIENCDETTLEETKTNETNIENTNGAHNVENTKSNTESTVEKPYRERRTSKRHHEEDSTAEDDTHSVQSSKKRSSGKEREHELLEKRTVVVKPHLLLSFVYFDASHCGYIFEKDLEELFSIIGLDLSRSQIRKVLGKMATRQAVYYRKLTDKDELADVPPSIEDTETIVSAEELKRMAFGNKQFEVVHKTFGTTPYDNEATDDGLVYYKGAAVHIGKLIEQLKRTEKNFSDLEKLYNDLRRQHTELQKEHSKSSGKIKELQSELKNVNRKLSDADQDLYSLNRKYKEQNSTLNYIYNRVEPYFSREKEKTSRDKENKDKDNKDKEVKEKNEKDKIKKEPSNEKKMEEKDAVTNVENPIGNDANTDVKKSIEA